MNFLYVPLVGLPICTFLIALGLILCATVVGIPLGLAVIGLGFKALTLKRARS